MPINDKTVVCLIIDNSVTSMLSAPRSRAEQLIYQRRTQEDKLVNMQTKLKQEFHHSQFARWHNKGKQIEVTNQVRQKLAALRQSAQANLHVRRQKLAQMLADQDAVYKQQIVDMQETPEQMRQRMAKRVKELKAEKEQRRKEDVNNKLERRFQQNADQLRKVDQDLKQLKLSYERNMQLVQKQTLLQDQYEQQVLFAELNRRDIIKKQEQDRLKMHQQKQKVDERNAILAIQKQWKKKKEHEQKVMSVQQKEMLRQQWEKQSELAKLKQRQAMQYQKTTLQTIHHENQSIKRDKEQQIRLEKEADRQMIERIVMKERQLAEYQKLMKEKERDEAKRTLAGARSKGQDMAMYEKELDRLIENERLKKERKQQEDWQKREKARINLLYQVYDDREKKVQEHRSVKDQELKIREQDKVEVQKRVREYEYEQEKRKSEEFERNRAEQQRLLDQIALKQEKRRLILQQLSKEEQEEQMSRQQYENKIQERKEQGKQKLDQFKKTNRLF